jgi:hypothetical protein
VSKIFELRPAPPSGAATHWQALLTNNIDMSSPESSGAPAEATATSPAPSAAPSFGTTRGSGLLRGKRPSISHASAAHAASPEYTPTAIEVVSAPREYQNPFAPAETPAAVTPAPSADSSPVVSPTTAEAPAKAEPASARLEQVEEVTTVEENPAPATEETPAPAGTGEPAGLNILPPEQQKTAPAQSWESEGFRPAREPRADYPRREEPRREERTERAPLDEVPTPEKFLYVRPGYNYVPTPSNYGGAPRENGPAAARPAVAAAPRKSGGILGWIKSLFVRSPAAVPSVETLSGDRRDGPHQHGRHRGGRGRGQGGGGQYAQQGEGQGEGQRRHRGGRGRSQYRGESRGGGGQGGFPAT